MSIPRNNAFSSAYLKPKDNIDPNKKNKDPKYSLEYSRYIYSQYMTNNSAIKSSMAERFVRNRTYAEGNQDTSQYKDWIFGSDNSTSPAIPIEQSGNGVDNLTSLRQEDLGLDNINWDDVFSPLPKYVENIIGLMRNQKHDITINAIDENSGSLREDMKYKAYIEEQVQAFITRFNAVFNIPDMNEKPVRPKSLEELELFENIGAFKLPYEIGMEKAIAHTFDISDFEELVKDNIIADFIVDGYSCVVVVQDPTTGKFTPIHKDVLDIILEDSKLADFSDSTWGGYIEYYTIHKLRIESGFKEDDIKDIAEKYSGQFGNSEVFDASKTNGAYKYDDYRIPVLHSFWKTVDTEYYVERDTKKGPLQSYEPYKAGGTKPPKPRKGRKLEKVDIRRLYNAKWVIGGDQVFNYGIVTNVPYNFGKNDVDFPIKLYKLKGKPKIESMIPIEDQIYLTFIKTQNAIAKAAPPGLAIEWGAIKNIAYGKKKLNPKDSIKLYTHSGNIVYQLDVKTIPGQMGSNRIGKPIEELRGGLGTAIADGIQGIEFLYRQLDVISGIDGITSATSTPSRDTGKAVSEMAVAATSNTLKPIYSGFLRLKVGAARVAAWSIQASLGAYTIKNINESPYYRALGRANLTAILTAGEYPPVVYGFNIDARATDAEKQQMLAAAQAGLAGGKNGVPAITYSEYSFIVRYLNSGKSIKYLELWMAKREQEREAMNQQIAQQNIKAQGEEQRKLEQEKAEKTRAEIELKNAAEIAVVKAKAEEERKTIELEYDRKRELLRDQMALKNLESNISKN